MRKNIFFIFITIMASMVSCSNDEQIDLPQEGSKKMVEVSFNTSLWEEEVLPMERASKVIADDIKQLDYFVYKYDDESFYKMKSFNQTDETLFANFKDTLPNGKYYIAIVGREDEFPDIEDSYFTWGIKNKYSEAAYHSGWCHIFYKTFELEVADNNINEKVVLPRITGQLEFIIKDSEKIVEEEFYKIGVSTNNIPTYFSASTGQAIDPSTISPGSSHGTVVSKWQSALPNLKYTPLIAGARLANDNLPNTKESRGEYILYYNLNEDGSSKIKKEAMMPTIYSNKKTRLSGYLFDENNNSGFDIEINSDWGGIEEGEFGRVAVTPPIIRNSYYSYH